MPRYATLILIVATAIHYGHGQPQTREPDSQRPSAEQTAAATVYWCEDMDAIDGFRASPAAVRRMVDALVRAVTGAATTSAAWASLAAPGETVGIKVTTSGGRLFSTRFALVASIVEGLQSAGMPGDRIVVWGRESAALREAGFTSDALGCRVAAIDGRFSEQPVYFSPRPGKLIWGDREFSPARSAFATTSRRNGALSSKSHFGALLAEFDTIINVPLLSDSAFTGLHGALASLALDSIDNWRRFARPPGFGAADLPQIWASDPLGPKVVLNIVDGLTAQYAGGPWFAPNYMIEHARIYASRDPVAIDATALAEIEGWREQAKLPPASRKAGHIAAAAQLGLGVAAPGRIETRQVTP